jgi:hypothetical protein
MTNFNEALERTLASHSLSGPDDLLGFKIDSDAAMAQEEGLDETAAEETGDDRRVLLLHGKLNRQVGSLEQVKQILWRIWERIAYQEYQATSTHFDEKAAVVRFVTTSGSQLCVTGEIRIDGPHYERLYRKGR